MLVVFWSPDIERFPIVAVAVAVPVLFVRRTVPAPRPNSPVPTLLKSVLRSIIVGVGIRAFARIACHERQDNGICPSTAKVFLLSLRGPNFYAKTVLTNGR